MQKIIVAIIVVMAGIFIVRKFGGFLSQSRGGGSGCGHCGCSDKTKKSEH